MPYGLYMSAAGADVQSSLIEVISHNLANVNTPGFKREVMVLQAQDSEAIQQGETLPGTEGIDDIGGGVIAAETKTDYSVGPVRHTGLATDLAIVPNDHFFVVDRNGEQLLTRAGNFRVDSDGRFMTQQGYAVLNENDEPLTVDPSLPYEVFGNGVVQQAGGVTSVKLVQPHSLGDLVRMGENLFSPLAPPNPVALPDRNVRVGYVEQSGVTATREMVELIEASRAYEANISMIQTQDQTVGTLINRVLG